MANKCVCTDPKKYTILTVGATYRTCGDCDKTCATCSGPANNECLTCGTNYKPVSSNQCSCADKHFLDTDGATCSPCAIKCS